MKRLISMIAMIFCGLLFAACLFELKHSRSEDGSGVPKGNAKTALCVIAPKEVPLLKWELLPPKNKEGFTLKPGLREPWVFNSEAEVNQPGCIDIREAVNVSDRWLGEHFVLTGIDLRCVKTNFREQAWIPEGALNRNTLYQSVWVVGYTQYHSCIPTYLKTTVFVGSEGVLVCSSLIAKIEEVGKSRPYADVTEAATIMEKFVRKNPEAKDYTVDSKRLTLRYDYSVFRYEGLDQFETLAPMYSEGEQGIIVVDGFARRAYVND